MAIYQIVKAATSIAAGLGASKIVGSYCNVAKSALSNRDTINKVCHFCGQVALELAAYNIASKTIDDTFTSYENMAHNIKVSITKAKEKPEEIPENEREFDNAILELRIMAERERAKGKDELANSMEEAADAMARTKELL